MSESNPISEKRRNQILSFAGVMGCMLLFLFILLLAYLPGRDADPLAATAEARQRHLGEMRARWANELVSVGVEDAERGLYKIPVEQAMELTVRDYQRKQGDS